MGHTVIPRFAVPVWLDTDLALGAPGGDVDDGIALAVLARATALASGPPLLGVSAVSGNTDGTTAVACIRTLLSELSCSAPVVAIGPPTTLVRAAALDPGFPARVDVRVVARVTRRFRHPLLALFEMLRRFDLESARRVLFPLTGPAPEAWLQCGGRHDRTPSAP